MAAFFLALCLLYDLIGRNKVGLGEQTDAKAGVQAGVPAIADTRLEVVMCCETLISRCCWTSDCGPGGPGFWDEHYPWSSFAVGASLRPSLLCVFISTDSPHVSLMFR